MTFDELVFGPHPNTFSDGKQALAFFDNGYGVSVVHGDPFLYSEQDTYEVAVLRGTADDWGLCYQTPITSDVLCDQTPQEVSDVMRRVAGLPAESEVSGDNC